MISKKAISPRPSIVFFGTGQTSLEALRAVDSYYPIELVVTKPPALNSSGRLFKNAVQQWAEENAIVVINPASKSDLIDKLKASDFKSKIGLVLDFGMVIPSEAIDMFPKGILNSHFSLLPRHRGSNPIRASILSGDTRTGVTIIKITPGLDDGPILSWGQIEIGTSNAIELRLELSKLNDALLPETIKLFLEGGLELLEQDVDSITLTHKTTKQDGQIDCTKPAEQIEREIRAYQGWPKSFFSYDNKIFSVIEAKQSNKVVSAGKLELIDKHLYLGCKDSSIEIIKIQPAGKPALSALDFINGYQNIIGK